MFSLLPLLFVAIALPAHAAVYKCANDKGGVTYQDTKCMPGKELRTPDVDPAAASVVPPTPPPADKPPPASAAKPARVQSGTLTVRGGSAAERKFLQAGMSEADVIQRVGRPDVQSEGPSTQGRRWTYLPTEGDPDMLTTLTFSDGKVAHVERKVMH